MISNYRERICSLIWNGCYIQSLHYHETPAERSALYDAQCAYISEKYRSIDAETLDSIVKNGNPGGGIWIGVFDGYRTSRDVIAPLFERYGLTGWFLLVTDFLDSANGPQDGEIDRLAMESTCAYGDRRYALTWEEAREIARRHHIVNHTKTHCWAEKELQATEETRQAGARIEKELGLKSDMVAFLGGTQVCSLPLLHRQLKALDMKYAVGVEMERIDRPETKLTSVDPVCQDVEEAKEILARLKAYHPVRVFTDGAPSILPMPQAKAAPTEETRRLAGIFNWIVMHEMEQGASEKEASLEAISAVAWEAIGRDFPMK